MSKNTVEIGGRKLPVPPASLKAIKRWMRAQQEVKLGSYEYLEEVSAFVCETLRKATPELEVDWLEEQLDESNIPVVLRAIYTAGKIESGEAQGPQES